MRNKLFLIVVFFLNSSVLWGMDKALIVQKIEKKNFCLQDIPYFPLVATQKYPAMADVIHNSELYQDSFVSQLACLPAELRCYVAEKMLKDKEAARVFVKMPFLYAVILYQKDKNFFESNSLLKKHSLGMFFRLPKTKRAEIVELSQSLNELKVSSLLFKEDVIMSIDDFVPLQIALEQIAPEESNNEHFPVLVQNPFNFKKVRYLWPLALATGVSFCSFAGLVTMCPNTSCYYIEFGISGVSWTCAGMAVLRNYLSVLKENSHSLDYTV